MIVLVACGAALDPDAARAAIPERVWGSYLGEASDAGDAGRVALDAAGNIYVAGYTDIAGLATPQAHKPEPVLGTQDGYLIKFDPAGERIWGTYFGGAGPERIFDLAVRGDRVVICGDTASDDGIASPGAFQTTKNPFRFGVRYVAAFSTDGAWLWGTYLNDMDPDGVVCSVAVGPDDTVDVAADGVGDVNLATPGVHQTEVAGAADVYLLHLGPAGERLWGTYYGGTAADRVRGVARDALGGIYIAGETRSASGIASPGAHQPVHGGVEYHDMFLARFTDGALDWGTYVGGELTDHGTAVAPHPDGGVVLAGYTHSPGLATPGTHQQAMFGAEDGLLTRFDGAGTQMWSTYFGGQNPDYSRDVATTPDGAVYLAGDTSSAVIATPDAFLSVFQGPTDAFLARFTGAGTLQWATYYGGPLGIKDGHEFAGHEFSANLATRGDDRVVLAGGTSSLQGIATPDAFTPTLEGVGLVAFVAVFTETPADDESSGTDETSSETTDGTATTDPETGDTDETTGTTGEDADTTTATTASTSEDGPAPTGDGPSTATADSDASDPTAPSDDSPADGCTCTAGPAAPGTLLPLFAPLLLRRRRPA